MIKASIEMDSKICKSLLHIVFGLMRKETGYEAAEIIATKALKSENPENRLFSLYTFIDLVNLSLSFESAEKAAIIGLEDKDQDVRLTAVDLFKLLAEKKEV